MENSPVGKTSINFVIPTEIMLALRHVRQSRDSAKMIYHSIPGKIAHGRLTNNKTCILACMGAYR